MTDERLCAICQRRHYERAHVCEPDRHWLDELLGEIANLYTDLPYALQPTGNTGQRVTGSRTPPLPLRVDILDLTLPANQGARALYARGLLGLDEDQTGTLSVATILDTNVRDWLTHTPGHRPHPTVPALAHWLRVRVTWACDHHPAVDEFASEMRELASALRRATGRTPLRPQPCEGVPCRRCDLLTLVRLADGSGDIECANPDCRLVLRADEYQVWCRLSAAALKVAS
jgi:hypothetical protein